MWLTPRYCSYKLIRVPQIITSNTAKHKKQPFSGLFYTIQKNTDYKLTRKAILNNSQDSKTSSKRKVKSTLDGRLKYRKQVKSRRLSLSKIFWLFWHVAVVVLIIALAAIYPSQTLAVSSSSKPLEAYDAPRNLNPKNVLNSKSPKHLVLDDSAYSPVHNPIYDGATTADFIPAPLENDQISLYTVKDGDRVSDIAKMYDVSVNTILWANDLNPKSPLQKGQVLIILPVNGVKYTVKSGDTLLSIALRFKSRVEDIVSFNNLETSGTKLAIGDEIIIPEGEEGSPKSPAPASGKDWIAPVSKNGLIAGYFIRPVPNGRKSQSVHGHNGIDIAAPTGSSILSAADGRVILAKVGGWGGGYGNYVIIQHPNGMQTLYAHMSSVAVSVGNSVKQGQLIGRVGSTGHSTGPHLHIEVHKIGSPNPSNKFY